MITVKYECSCKEKSREKAPDDLFLFDLHSLYFCKECKIVQCSYCVIEELKFYYCPSCFLEFTKSSAEKCVWRCPKCYVCPCCESFVSKSPCKTCKKMLSNEKEHSELFYKSLNLYEKRIFLDPSFDRDAQKPPGMNGVEGMEGTNDSKDIKDINYIKDINDIKDIHDINECAQKVSLRYIPVKKCKKCFKILVMPSYKAGKVMHSVKELAIRYIPLITVEKILQAESENTLYITALNLTSFTLIVIFNQILQSFQYKSLLLKPLDLNSPGKTPFSVRKKFHVSFKCSTILEIRSGRKYIPVDITTYNADLLSEPEAKEFHSAMSKINTFFAWICWSD